MRKVMMLMCCLTVNLCNLYGTPVPAVRLEISSAPELARNLSRLGNCIAPDFRNTVALATVALTMGGTAFGMDLTRPAEIAVYGFKDKLSLLLAARVSPEVREIPNETELFGRHVAVRRKGGTAVLVTDDLAALPFPARTPGAGLRKKELLRAEIRPELFRKYFSFQSLDMRGPARRLLLHGLDELAAELEKVELSLAADEKFLSATVVATARRDSALARWLEQPLPPTGRIAIFPGATSLAVIRLPPAATLRRYGREYLSHLGLATLPSSLPEAVNGFAVFSARTDNDVSAAKLALGLRPEYAAKIRTEVKALDYTPFPDLYRVRRQPPLCCFAAGGELIFYGLTRLERPLLEAIRKESLFTRPLPEGALVVCDVAAPERPLVKLTFSGRRMRLVVQAEDSRFAALPPLMDKPLRLRDAATE